MIRSIRALLAGLVLMLSGCGYFRYVPPPKLSGAALSAADAEVLLGKLKQRETQITSWRSLSRTVVTHGKDQAHLRHVILFVRPDKLRVEALPVNGAFTLGLLAASGGRGVFLDPNEKRAVIGTVDSGMVEQVIGLPLSEKDLMDYLTGSVPLRSGDEAAGALQVYADQNSGRLTIREGASRYYVLNLSTLLLETVHVRSPFNDALQYELGYSEYQEVQGVRVPGRIEIWMPEREVKVELKQTSIAVNVPIQDKMFVVEVPGDYAVKR